MLGSSSLEPPKTGRSRFSKALPSLPPLEPFEPLEVMNQKPEPTPAPAPAQQQTAFKRKELPPSLPHLSSTKDTTLPPLPVPAETYLHSPLPALPPQTRQQPPQTQPAPEPANFSPQQQAAPPPKPQMSIPRRPVAKPAAVPPKPPEPVSPSGSISSLLSAYSRSSGESIIRSSDGGGDGTANSSTVATFSPTKDSGIEMRNGFPLPPRSASLATKDAQPPATSNGLILPENKTYPPALPEKDERRPPNAQREESGEAPNHGPPTSAAPDESGMRSRSSSQATSDLWVRRTARSNHPHEVPELKLTISNGRTSEDSQVLPHPSRSAVSASHNSPARPLQPASFANTPVETKSQSPLPPLPPQPADASQQGAGDKMGQKSSKMKDKINALRGGVSKHLKGSLSQGEATTPSPLSQQLTPVSRRSGGESASVSPLSSEIPQDEGLGQVQAQQMQTQQQQQQPQQQFHSQQDSIGSNTLHAARSLPEMKSLAPQTSNERPPPISSDYTQPRDSPLPQQTPQDPPPAEYKFPPRTSSTQAAAPPAQRSQQLPERGRPRAASNATFDGRAPSVGPRAPSLGPRIPRVASNTSLAEYAAPPPRVRKSDDTVYRELIQDDLPPPDPRAMYFPQQTSQPAPSDTVFRAPSVSAAHHACFQTHSKMIMARNKYYPLSCMACEVEDAELRWQCAWCRLRICGECMKLLQRYNRDLGKVLDHIASQPDRGSGVPASNGSRSERGSGGAVSNGSRPGSEGLEKVMEDAEKEKGPSS